MPGWSVAAVTTWPAWKTSWCASVRRAYLDIELKVDGNEEAIVAAVRANRPQRGFVVSSFLPEVVLRLHELDSSLPLGYVCDREENIARWTDLPITAFFPRHDLVSQQIDRRRARPQCEASDLDGERSARYASPRRVGSRWPDFRQSCVAQQHVSGDAAGEGGELMIFAKKCPWRRWKGPASAGPKSFVAARALALATAAESRFLIGRVRRTKVRRFHPATQAPSQGR